MVSLPYPHSSNPTVTAYSSTRRPLHRPLCSANVPDSRSSPINRRSLLIGSGTGALYFASSLLSPARRDPGPGDLTTFPTALEMDAAEAATSDGDFPRVLDAVVSATVKRTPKKAGRSREEEEEVLVIDGIEVLNNVPAKFDVLINVEDWRACGPRSSEFAGSFVHVPRKPWRPEEKVRTRLTLGIAELLEQIGAEKDEEVMVTLVPRAGRDVRVGGLRIDYSS